MPQRRTRRERGLVGTQMKIETRDRMARILDCSGLTRSRLIDAMARGWEMLTPAQRQQCIAMGSKRLDLCAPHLAASDFLQTAGQGVRP